MALANVSLTNTFDEWRTRTNQTIYTLDRIELNVANSINYANTAFLAKTGGVMTGNVTFTGSNLILDLL